MKAKLLFGSALTCAAFGMAGCGGGDGGSAAAGGSALPGTPAATSTADTVPPTAVASVDTFFDYQKTLGASETIEPLALQQKLPPIDDTKEPTPIF